MHIHSRDQGVHGGSSWVWAAATMPGRRSRRPTLEPEIGSAARTAAPSARAARIGSLLRGTNLKVRPSARCGGEEGLFSTGAVEEGTVLLTDCPLCWLPEEGAPQTSVEPSRLNCEQCGAFIAEPAVILQRLAGDATPLKLPLLGDAAPKKHVCPRPAPEHPLTRQCRVEPNDAPGAPLARDGLEQVQMAAQLLARMARQCMGGQLACQVPAAASRAGEEGRAEGRAAGRADAEARSLAILDALASPTWEVVCRADEDEDEAAEALPSHSLPAVERALRRRAGVSVLEAWGAERTAQLYSRALGCVARNSLWVQVIATDCH